MFKDATVITEAISTAQSLMTALEISPRWTSDTAWSCPWVFRGQRDAEWGLTPAAWRSEATIPMQRLAQLRQRFAERSAPLIRELLERIPSLNGANPGFVVKSSAQARAEFTLILEFVRLADELGHFVPDMDTYLRQANLANDDYLIEPYVRDFPLVRFLPGPNPTAALAQHHGVPTRLLDWTRNPLYAAHFAASEVDPTANGGSIAIWAIRLDHLRTQGGVRHHHDGYTRFLDHTVSNSDNRYLHSQEGLFIHPVYGCAHCAKTGEFPNLEAFAVAVERELSAPTIRKLTLPCCEAGELLRLLWLKGVSRAHLMPTLDNVTQALCSRWKWAP